MPNYFTDNTDLLYQFDRLDLKEIVEMTEDNFKQAGLFDDAPLNYEDAKENYKKVLEVVGDIAANFVAPRAAQIDEEGAVFKDGKVEYAQGTKEALEMLSKAELMGMILPREYGGLNFPTIIYMIAVELISRAEASLMNIFGLQDIGKTIERFGNELQRQEFLPKFVTGEYTGAMVLTEPDAGSDLQAVKLNAYQDENGNWFLRGVKRFITNGNGEVLLVLARTEPGTTDARGLSMLVCYGDDTVKVRRIEHKLGIHGSPTCELQFNDTPAQLVGSRKFGLLKYVMYLMNRARIGIGAQSLGISQQAYEEALKYAKAREQFGKPIYNLPVVSNMLIDMRVTLEANRSLLYASGIWVDKKEKLEELVEKLKLEKQPFADVNEKLKEALRVVGLLTPISKYILSESANKITYDALQIHGGTGYMKEFMVERLVRDARITNIYEGTSQLQIVAAAGGVINDVLAEYFNAWEAQEYKGSLSHLLNVLIEIRSLFYESLKYVKEKQDVSLQEVASKDLVELYTYIYVGYLLLNEANEDQRKVFTARRYILDALANARKNAEAIKSELYSDILHADTILI
ncbi:MAG: acyl-CoA dehydrogenase [Candidatus Marinimicrobia bacterium CG1_02_48_14]|nr:MAG: acyl-CoA dehydrogenase [Candidatus Marinimicrobia bacterium CG1_02_48_14]PIZ64172.1 MAG: acyl-CoA dehydrogenase [Candidatus Marinimicrobia bacterium CG_4_10_14_0_2_um_filter_48_9]PJA54299.1 MAG: acyl-CoA dehydrogenase [Candidatus Marinimicrobia bacterium CG_4_9_14_3_um_filter_48_9]